MKVLVTGGAGFIGSHLVASLLSENYKVRVLDDLSSGKRSNLEFAHDQIELIVGDVASKAVVLDAVTGVDCIVHMAAVASVQKTIGDPIGSHHVNYIGTLNLLEAARESGCDKIVFSSTAAVYGDNEKLPLNEFESVNPMSPYALDKYFSEIAMKMYCDLYDMKGICLRYFNVFGPKQDPCSPYSGVISKFVNDFVQKRPSVIFGDGKQTRDFVYVSDVVRANMLAITSIKRGFEIYNVASGRQCSINELYHAIHMNSAGGGGQCQYLPARSGDIRFSQGDPKKIHNDFNWKSEIEVADGIEMLLENAIQEAELAGVAGK